MAAMRVRSAAFAIHSSPPGPSVRCTTWGGRRTARSLWLWGKAGSREQLFSAFLSELGLPPAPHIVVFEDAHWVDDATLDLLKFVGRRIRDLPALLVITYRDDEVGPHHQLHRFLGELPRDAVRRLHLPLLSEAAVRRMARRKGRTAEGVHALTGGNPFFVTEILASRTTVVPASIREAVFARATRLSAEARCLLDLVAVVPGKMECVLLETLLVDAPRLTRECAASGVLVAAARHRALPPRARSNGLAGGGGAANGRVAA